MLEIRRRGRVLERHPRARGLAVLFVAVAEIQERPRAGIEALAFGELRARLAEFSVGHELARLLEEGLGGGLIGRVLRQGESGRKH